MLKLERTTDLELVRRVVTNESIWDKMSDDYAPPREEYQPPADQAIYILVSEGIEIHGIWVLVPRSHIRFEIHTCLLPSLRGFRALDAAARCAQWIWQNTACESLYTEIPSINRPAIWFARVAGMKQTGIEPQAFRKGGVLYDVVTLAMHRPGPEGVDTRR